MDLVEQLRAFGLTLPGAHRKLVSELDARDGG
jgi:hypothetical protein